MVAKSSRKSCTSATHAAGSKALRTRCLQCLPCLRNASPHLRHSPTHEWTTSVLYCTDIPGEGKVWVVLFTCLTIRARPLFISRLQRTLQPTSSYKHSVDSRISRCGTPRELLSDNAPHFRVADEALTTAWSSAVTDTQVTTNIASAGITWRFIPAHTPWMGGVYERMVGQVQRCLRKLSELLVCN